MSYASGMIMLLTMVLTYCVSTVGWLVGLTVTAFIIPVGFLLACAIVARCATRCCFLWAVLVNIVSWLIFTTVSAMIYDYSWDGIAYHQVTVYALADGWNPVWDASYTNWLSLWSKHYACGLELISSCIYGMTGNLESGKAVNLLFGLASFLICLDVVRRVRPGFSKSFAFLLTLIAVSNPVWICQTFTFYIDYVMYFYILMTMVFSIEIVNGNNVKLSRIGLVGMILLAIENRITLLYVPEYGTIRYNWLEADADDRAKIDSLYKNHQVCVFRNNLVEFGESTYWSIKSKLGWKSSD